MKSMVLAIVLLLGTAAAAQAPAPSVMTGTRGHGAGMFAAMSPAGRTIMWQAMRSGDREAGRDAVRAARDRVLTVLDAPTLDVAALKRAMDEERSLSEAQQTQRQAAMLAGFQQLSLADRKAFVTDARAMKARMGDRMERGWKGRGGSPEALAPPSAPPQ